MENNNIPYKNMNFDFLDGNKFRNAVNNKQAAIFLNMPLPEITWESVLQFVNDHPEKRTGKKKIVSEHAFFHDEAQIITNVNYLVREIHSRFYPSFKDPQVVTCQLFGSTKLENGQTIGRHEDRENNLFWQGKGKSRWRLYKSEDAEQPFIDIILQENDLIYIPGGTYHYVEPITPRFGFAILFGDDMNYESNKELL